MNQFFYGGGGAGKAAFFHQALIDPLGGAALFKRSVLIAGQPFFYCFFKGLGNRALT